MTGERISTERKQGYGTVNIVCWHDKRYKKPLYLLTNLDHAPQAERLYRKRYTLETLFADFKSRGFNMKWAKIDNPLTIFNLLIVAAKIQVYFLHPCKRWWCV